MRPKGRKSEGPSPARMIRSLVIIVVVSVVFGLIAKGAMDMLNRKMGIDPDTLTTGVDTTGQDQEYELPEMPDYDPVETMETVSSVWTPDWKATACSLYVTAGGDAVMDSLPQAPDNSGRATELQLLMELWAGHSGYSSTDAERVWAFTSGDTCFVDLPVQADWDAVASTIEARFISYTRLFPFTAGEQVSGYDDGIALRGIPAN